MKYDTIDQMLMTHLKSDEIVKELKKVHSGKKKTEKPLRIRF